MNHTSEEPEDDEEGEVRRIELPAGLVAERLDKALAAALPDISRARLKGLIESGRVSREGAAVTDASAKAQPGLYELLVPPPAPDKAEPQALPLDVLYEDEHLIVVDKRAGMAVHPAPGSPDRTLVNALLHHCRGRLSGIGGVARPGIVHRLDKDTSGVMVAAKSDKAHEGLAAQFARHDLERVYIALTRGAPAPSRGTVQGRIGRSPHDRKKMAVLRSGGREAVTGYAVERAFGPAQKPLAARVACRLKTGRTHQIRVHLASKGAPVLGDPIYGSGPPSPQVRRAIEAAGLKRQALHAAVLGFTHPITGAAMRFESLPPEDMGKLEALLAAL
jgi:23S rRNA pseudouridine1911/1915/1917 synthase